MNLSALVGLNSDGMSNFGVSRPKKASTEVHVSTDRKTAKFAKTFRIWEEESIIMHTSLNRTSYERTERIEHVICGGAGYHLTRSPEKRNYTTLRSKFKILSTCFEYYSCTCNAL